VIKNAFVTEEMILEGEAVPNIVLPASASEEVILEDITEIFLAVLVSVEEDVDLEDVPGTSIVINIFSKEALHITEAIKTIGPTTDGVLSGQYRVQNNTLDRYEAYLGIDAWPDLTDDLVNNPPWDTFSTWPHTLPALAPDATYYLVIRKRDSWGLIEGNVDSAIIRIGPGGELLEPGPTAPFNAELLGEPVGRVRFRANYNLQQDPVPADKWRVYLTSDGTDPDTTDPGDLYLEQSMGIQRVEDLDTPSADSWVHGTVIKAIIVTYRTPDDTQSLTTSVLEYTIDLTAPALPDGELFLGGGADG